MTLSKDPIKLRKRTMPNTGNVSLYLDTYINGKRKYESLKLYLVPEKKRADKELNRETMRLANAIRAKRVVELQNGRYGFEREYTTDTLFFEYYEAMCEKKLLTESVGTWASWRSTLLHLYRYEQRRDITFGEITTKWVQGFRDYLDSRATVRGVRSKGLAVNTKMLYFSKLRACLNQACKERVIPHNPFKGVKGFKVEEVVRQYLTLEEIRLLSTTECDNANVRRAFLFSCLTGLRRSDIEKMTWSNVQRQGEFTRIFFRQKKTKGQEYLDITEQAVGLIGERGKESERVFGDFLSPNYTNNCIQNWVYKAGINKKITFHCGRHTFAVLMLDIGTDIYTVSKLLGHRDLQTTQIYAKILDKNKQIAVAKIPSVL